MNRGKDKEIQSHILQDWSESKRKKTSSSLVQLPMKFNCPCSHELPGFYKLFNSLVVELRYSQWQRNRVKEIKDNVWWSSKRPEVLQLLLQKNHVGSTAKWLRQLQVTISCCCEHSLYLCKFNSAIEELTKPRINLQLFFIISWWIKDHP